MTSVYYYEYCKDILGVKSNMRDFKWMYGSYAPLATKEKYNQCKVRFDISIKPEKELNVVTHYNRKFQAYMWDANCQTLYYRRKLVSNFSVGFNIQIDGNTVFAEIGEHYYKFIKNRTMNLHGIYYLLSDIANMLLLKNGLLTLYAAGIHCKVNNKGVVFLAPPNTGKTFTAVKLCETSDFVILGEDLIITDGVRMFACPWTCSFRKEQRLIDDAGAFGRTIKKDVIKACDECELTDVVVLSIGEESIERTKRELFRQISILNGYLFNYFSSPIVKVLAFMDKDYCQDWETVSNSILETIVTNCDCLGIQTAYPQSFQNIILDNLNKNYN